MVGNITQPNGYPLELKNSKIYLLDVRNYTWVNTFEPSTPSNTASSMPSNPSTPSTTSLSSNPSIQTSINANTPESMNQLTTMKVVIAAMGGIFGTFFLMAIGFFGYRWYKNRQNEI